MTRDEVGQLPARMSLYWQAVPGEERSQSLVDFGQGWLVPARLVREALLAAYDHWDQEGHPAPPATGTPWQDAEF